MRDEREMHLRAAQKALQAALGSSAYAEPGEGESGEQRGAGEAVRCCPECGHEGPAKEFER